MQIIERLSSPGFRPVCIECHSKEPRSTHDGNAITGLKPRTQSTPSKNFDKARWISFCQCVGGGPIFGKLINLRAVHALQDQHSVCYTPCSVPMRYPCNGPIQYEVLIINVTMYIEEKLPCFHSHFRSKVLLWSTYCIKRLVI